MRKVVFFFDIFYVLKFRAEKTNSIRFSPNIMHRLISKICYAVPTGSELLSSKILKVLISIRSFTNLTYIQRYSKTTNSVVIPTMLIPQERNDFPLKLYIASGIQLTYDVTINAYRGLLFCSTHFHNMQLHAAR